MQMSVRENKRFGRNFITLCRKYKSTVEASNVWALKSFTSVHSLPTVLSTTRCMYVPSKQLIGLRLKWDSVYHFSNSPL